MSGVIVVVATTENGVADVRARLYQLGAPASDVLAPSDTRRLLLAPVAGEAEGERVVARFRALGDPAVVRPAGGPRLEAWVQHTRPIVVGDRIAVCFAWSEHDRRNLPGVVELDPDGGFGSGQHPATRLVIEELAARLRGGERVLDVGCGSGVLGLCALRLGAAGVVGVDLDEASVAATRRNAGLNGYAAEVGATPAPLDAIDGVFDVVLANVGRAALVDLAPQLLRLVSPTGWLATSGFSPSQCALVAGFLAPLQEIGRRISGEWAQVTFSRR